MSRIGVHDVKFSHHESINCVKLKKKENGKKERKETKVNFPDKYIFVSFIIFSFISPCMQDARMISGKKVKSQFIHPDEHNISRYVNKYKLNLFCNTTTKVG